MVDVTFDHAADDAWVGEALFDEFFEDGGLASWIFRAVGVAAVSHDRWREACGFELFAGFFDVFDAVVRALGAAA